MKREITRKTTYDFNLKAFLNKADELIQNEDPYDENILSSENVFTITAKRLNQQFFIDDIGESFFEINSESDIKMFAEAITYWPNYYNEDEDDYKHPLIEQLITDEMFGDALKIKSKKKVFI